MDCIFCKIINNEIPSYTIYEDELVKVILDINPSVDGHALIIPKKHFDDYMSLDSKTASHIFEIAKTVGANLITKLNAKSLSLLVNYGASLEVNHFHMHILPEYQGIRSIMHPPCVTRYRLLLLTSAAAKALRRYRQGNICSPARNLI